MGNYISCTLSSNTYKHSNGAKVILPNGEIRQYDTPINAAELMFEIPNYFLVNSRSLQIGRRFFALNAEEDLEMGSVYVMFQMKRVNSVVTAGDMAALFVTTNSTAKRSSGGMVRVMPESTVKYDCRESETPRLSLDDIEDISVQEFQYRLSICRSKRPVLETIVEEPICSR